MRSPKIFLFAFLLLRLSAFAQVKSQYDAYGYSNKFLNSLANFEWMVSPDQPKMYVLIGVNPIDPSKILNTPPFIDFKIDPPQVRLFVVDHGELNPVLDCITGTVTGDTFSAVNLQQWEFRYDQTIGKLVNVMLTDNILFPKTVQIIDSSFHLVSSADIIDPHDIQFSINSLQDSVIWQLRSTNTSHMIAQTFDQSATLGEYSTSPEDTVQSMIDSLTCLQQFLGTDFKEYFHTNSIDRIPWNGDTMLVATSERHTSKIRFAWFLRQPDGSYQSSLAFILASSTDPYNQVTCTNADFSIEAGHDFRFVKKFGDSIVCTYFDNHSCSLGAKGMTFVLYPLRKEVTLVNVIHPDGDSLIFSQGLGCYRAILDQDSSYESILTAPRIFDWDGFFASRPPFMPTPSVKVPIRMSPAILGNICILDPVQNKQLTGINFQLIPNSTQELSKPIEFGQVYRATAYYPAQIGIMHQPHIQCRPAVSPDSVQLYVEGLQVQMWNTGDTTQELTVPKNQQFKRYLVRGKTDDAMLGWLYSEPFTLKTAQCLTTGLDNKLPVSVTTLFYPNPTKEEVTLTRSGRLAIYSVLGEQLLTRTITAGEKVNLASLAPGVYLICLETPEGTFTDKLIRY